MRIPEVPKKGEVVYRADQLDYIVPQYNQGRYSQESLVKAIIKGDTLIVINNVKTIGALALFTMESLVELDVDIKKIIVANVKSVSDNNSGVGGLS